MKVARPPAIAGLPSPSRTDVLNMVRWGQVGYRHGVRHNRGFQRAFSKFLAIMWWPSFPLLYVAQHISVRQHNARYYMSPDRDAVLAIVAKPDGWHVGDHATSQPGAGLGKKLRGLALPELLGAADEQKVAIIATAATKNLADQYRAEVPGLVDVGPGQPRGRKLRRLPV